MAILTTNLIPSIGAAGVYTLAAPFDTLLIQNVQYTCLEIRQLEGIIAEGVDPYQTYYVPQSVSQDQYNSDLANNVCVVTLQASSGSLLYVPTSFVVSFPSSGGVPYNNLMLAVDLGALPDFIDLTYLKQQIVNLVSSTIGYQSSTVTTVVVSATTELSLADSQTAEAARQANITNTNTPESQVIALTAQLQSLQQAYSNLEAYLNANIDKITGTIPTAPIDELDPTFVPAGITLTNGNLTATSTQAGWQTARGTAVHTSGQLYAEATINTLAGSVGFGVCNASQLSSAQIGSDTNGISIWTTLGGSQSNIEYNGGVAQASGLPMSESQVIGMAIDLNAKLIWFYNPADQTWNGESTNTQNPATSLGGLPLQAIAVPSGTAVPVYLGISLDAATDAITINAGATSFVNTIPTGFSPWNSAT